MSTTTKPVIFAHRGASGEAPENTLAAFKLGLAQGCDAFELDVHLSKDGQIVVIHDGTIDRTTDGLGAVNEMTVEELKAFDAGSWFDEKYRGERIPLLEEVFDITPGHIIINIEIKGSYNGQLEPALIDLLKKRDRLDTVVISSFDWKSLRYIKELEPGSKSACCTIFGWTIMRSFPKRLEKTCTPCTRISPRWSRRISGASKPRACSFTLGRSIRMNA